VFAPRVRELARADQITEMTGGEASQLGGFFESDGVVADRGERLLQLYGCSLPQTRYVRAATPVTELLGALTPGDRKCFESLSHTYK
jgi:hypothetical protein